MLESGSSFVILNNFPWPSIMKPNGIDTFQRQILAYYAQNGCMFPWRETKDPYSILVSEFMLQQTQTVRITNRFPLFIKRFPTISVLAGALFPEVLSSWQGIGYNRRARYLYDTANTITRDYQGEIPKDVAILDSLPGIGSYTASAICAFAFNMPVVLIETNIRAVFIHLFFKDSPTVSDVEILPIVESTLYREDPRTWYYALMDYGSMLKRKNPNPNRRSKHYTRQPKFEGSRRQKRGAILRLLLTKESTAKDVAKSLNIPLVETMAILESMANDFLVVSEPTGGYRIAD